MKSKKSKKVVSVVVTGVMILSLGVVGFSAYKVIPKLMEYKASDDTFNKMRDKGVREYEAADLLSVNNKDVSEEEADDSSKETPVTNTADIKDALHIDWEAFTGTEIVAWLQMDAINYPVMQSSDNDKYLHHLPDGSYNYGGTLFLYSHNNPLFSDQSSFIYGHNMANGSMFGTLKHYAKSDYTNHCFYVYLPDGTRRTYRFYSIASVKSDSNLYTWAFASDDSFLEWQTWVKEHSIYPNAPQPSKDAKYVTLSTCNGYAGTTSRLIVCGQLETIDTLQEPASWYSDYIAKYTSATDEKHKKADEIRTGLEQYLTDQRVS